MDVPAKVYVTCPLADLKQVAGTLIAISPHGFYEVHIAFGSNTHSVLLPVEGTSLTVMEPILTPPEVIIPETATERVAREANAELRDLADEISDGCRVVETAVRRGIAFFEIIEAAKALGADLVVVGTHGRTGLSRALLGSTAERVTRHAPCPVLVVHHANGRG